MALQLKDIIKKHSQVVILKKKNGETLIGGTFHIPSNLTEFEFYNIIDIDEFLRTEDDLLLDKVKALTLKYEDFDSIVDVNKLKKVSIGYKANRAN